MYGAGAGKVDLYCETRACIIYAHSQLHAHYFAVKQTIRASNYKRSPLCARYVKYSRVKGSDPPP